MNTNGMTFGLEGPQITGWWVNPKTGDKFNAVDTFFQDNQLIIKTTDGRLLNYNQIQNYVQTNNPGAITPQTQAPKSQSSTNDLPPEILNEIEQPDDVIIPDDNIYGDPVVNKNSSPMQLTHPSIKDFDIIDRALNKKSTPTPVAQVKWYDFPKREIEMLVDVMNISENEIIQYYINNISVDTVKQMLNDAIENYITAHLHEKIEKQTEVRSSSSGTSTKTTETTTKKTTKKK